MNRNLIFVCSLTALAVAPGYSQSDSHVVDVKAIKAIEAQANTDYETKDVDKLVAFYADDAVLMAPGSPPSRGKDSIRSAIKEMIGDSAFSLKFEAKRVTVAKSGDMAFTEGTYNMTVTDPVSKKPVDDKGTYVTVYMKQPGGSWKAISDIASSQVLVAPAPAAQ